MLKLFKCSVCGEKRSIRLVENEPTTYICDKCGTKFCLKIETDGTVDIILTQKGTK